MSLDLVTKIILEGSEDVRKGILSVKNAYSEMSKEAKANLAELDKQAKENQKTFDALKKVTTPLGLAMVAVGAAGLKLIDESLQLNAQLSQTAIVVGITDDKMRDLVLSTSDVSMGIEETISVLDQLARSGINNTTTLKATAQAIDSLSHVAGVDADTLTGELIPAYNALGISLPMTANGFDSLSWLVKNTTVNVSDFASVMSWVAREGDTLNITLDDMVAMLAALQAKGIQGTAATRMFRTAVTEAAKSGKSLASVLGITQSEIDGYKTKLQSAGGITEKYAAAAEKQFGVMARIKQIFSELKLQVGTFLQPLEGALIAFTALGSALVAWPIIMPKAIIALNALKLALATTAGVVGMLVAGLGIAGTLLYGWISNMSGAKIDTDAWSTSLQRAKDDLAELEAAGKGSTQMAADLRTEITDLTDAIVIFAAKVKDDNKVIDKTNALAKAKENLIYYTDLYARMSSPTASASETMDFTFGPEVENARAEVANLQSDIIDLTAGIKDQIDAILEQSNGMSVLRGIYASASDEMKTWIDLAMRANAVSDAQSQWETAATALKKYYGIAEEESKSLIEQYEDEVNARKDALNDELDAIRRTVNAAIKEYQREYNAKVRVLDKETNATVAALQAQLDAMDEKEGADEEARLRKAVADAWSREGKAEAQKALDEFLTQKAREALQKQIQDVQDAAQDQKDTWQEELDNKIQAEQNKLDAAETRINAELDSLANAVDLKKAEYQRDYENALASYDSTLAAYQKLLSDQKAATETTWDDILKTIQQKLSAEVEATIDSWNGLSAAASSVTGTTPWTIDNSGVSYGSGPILPNGPTLSGYANGGDILEPTLLYGLKSQRAYAVAGEAGVEHVGPGASSSRSATGKSVTSITFTGNNFIVREEADIKKIGRALYREIQLYGSGG